jgi:hypothetical protein
LGDVTFLGKYRLISKNEEHGNYILTFFLGGSIPTGVYKNGSKAAVVTPYVAAGKGWGHFDVQSTLGGGLPVTNQSDVGHAIAGTRLRNTMGSTISGPNWKRTPRSGREVNTMAKNRNS